MHTQFCVQENFDLTDYNTMGVSSKAAFFADVNSIDELQKAIKFSKKNSLEILVLGGGSNILFKSDFEGLVIHNSLLGKELLSEDEIKVSAGENWHKFVLFCVEHG